MSAKSDLERIEKSLHPDDDGFDISVNWRDDDLYEWKCEDGSIELITREEFEKRGGVIVEWSDDDFD